MSEFEPLTSAYKVVAVAGPAAVCLILAGFLVAGVLLDVLRSWFRQVAFPHVKETWSR